MATKRKTKTGAKAAQSKRQAERKRSAGSAGRTRTTAGKRAAPSPRAKSAPPKKGTAKNKPKARSAKSAAKPKSSAKSVRAPAHKPAARPQAKPKVVSQRPGKPAPKPSAPQPPSRELAPPSAGERHRPTAGQAGEPTSGAEVAKAREGKSTANGAARTAAAALKARMPVPETVRKLADRTGPASEREVFAEGDFVVYPTHGVGRVVAIETQQIAGLSLPLIVITFDKDRMMLRVPVAKAHNSGLRKLSSRKVMDTALATLKGRSRVKRTMWSRRAQEYEAKINSGDPVSIAEVVRDLHRGSDQPDQSYSERQIYQAALDRLARELAAVERIDEQAAAQRLEEMLKAA